MKAAITILGVWVVLWSLLSVTSWAFGRYADPSGATTVLHMVVDSCYVLAGLLFVRARLRRVPASVGS